MNYYDITIIGGGLAGLTAALQLSKLKYRVLLIEKHSYPNHKVCGEYVSNEIIPYLNSLGVNPVNLGAVSINTVQLSTIRGKSTTVSLPLGGIGISRYAFDKLLFDHAVKAGVNFVFDTVTEVSYKNDGFTIVTANKKRFTTKITIGAYGKRANLDVKTERAFIKKKSYWMGVKAHYKFDDFPDNLVALHNFKGGYAGLSKTETGAVNFCYLNTYKSFRKCSDIEHFNKYVVSENPYLKDFLERAIPLFEKPITIAQISFCKKKTVENHMIMCGDTAGLIHPLCGNGMAMAIHSAKIASELIHDYFTAKIKNRETLEAAYTRNWNRAFKQRIWTGQQLQSILLSPTLSDYAMTLAGKIPFLLKNTIAYTHGKPVLC